MNNLEHSFLIWSKHEGKVTLSPEAAYKAGFEFAMEQFKNLARRDEAETIRTVYAMVSIWSRQHYEKKLRGTDG